MSALELEGHGMRAEDAVEIVDCGQASERTKGNVFGVAIEFGSAPFNYFVP